jgi:hypothetical protein
MGKAWAGLVSTVNSKSPCGRTSGFLELMISLFCRINSLTQQSCASHAHAENAMCYHQFNFLSR